MDEEKKIMEKRSSFRGWKERNKGKIDQKRNIAIAAIIIFALFTLVTYPYWSKMGDGSSPAEQQNKTPKQTPVKNVKTNVSNSGNGSLANTVNATNTPKKVITGKINTPIIDNLFEITVKNVNPSTILYTSIWMSVTNMDDNDKQFKISSGTVIIDNMGQQYENIRVAKSAEISQTNLSSQAMREGAIFFERLKEGRTLKKLILSINNNKIEFMLETSDI